MADLTHDDAVHAAQAGTRDIFNLVQRLQTQIQQMGNVQRAVNQIAAMQQQLIMCNRQIQAMNERMDQLARQSGYTPDPNQNMISTRQEMADLKSRFAAVERFAMDVSEYLRAQEGA